jgi:hypothetical protein
MPTPLRLIRLAECVWSKKTFAPYLSGSRNFTFLYEIGGASTQFENLRDLFNKKFHQLQSAKTSYNIYIDQE